MKKKFIAIIMAVAMTTALAACNNGTGTGDSKPETEISVSAKGEKDDTKKEASKKEASDKKKAESDKNETDKQKESETKSETSDTEKENQETDKADNGDKDNSAKKPAAGSDNASSKPENKPAGNPSNHGGSNKPDTPSQPETLPSAPTPPSEPEPTQPTHVCSFDTVIGTTPGNCSQAEKITKQCSCGATITVDGSFGDHNWQDQYEDTWHEPVIEERPVFEKHYLCNQCGMDFGLDGVAAGKHTIVTNGCQNYSLKKVQVGTETVVVEEGYTSHDYIGRKCTVCGQNG